MNQHKPQTSNASQRPRPAKPDTVAGSAAPERDPGQDDGVHGDGRTLVQQVLRLHAAVVANAPPLAFELPRLPRRTRPHGFRHPIKHGSARWLTHPETKALIAALGVDRVERILRTMERDSR
ncbi:hypothetical protein [Mesorhizobium sp.]|uniref:hypothetical protein n=1 Tax=Mesorhizobium sp. TaxID=1871066 RepID=UPI0025CDCE4D|nr:hypothetical protein [Mesorhizobium sp.]